MKSTCPSASPSPQAQPGQQQSAAAHPSSPATDRLSGSNQEKVKSTVSFSCYSVASYASPPLF